MRERERVEKCTVVPIGFVAQRGRTAYVVSSLGVARRRNLLYLDLRQAAICRYLSDNHCLLHPLQMNNLLVTLLLNRPPLISVVVKINSLFQVWLGKQPFSSIVNLYL